MLLELRVQNLLLIEHAELRLEPGLNVITGETGAGKTVLAHALDLLLGGKPRPGIVRPGADDAYVEGVFAAPPGVLDDDELDDLRARLPDDDAGELVLARRVSAEGRTRAFVQGRSASAADLAQLGSRLVSFYGQHEHRRLTLASVQLELLDAFCGSDHLALRARFADGVAGTDPEFDALTERLRALAIEAADLGADFRRYLAGVEADPERLVEVEARIDLYERLKRKHGGDVDGVLAHAERCRRELAALERADDDAGELAAELERAAAEEAKLAARLTGTRRAAAAKLADAVRA